MLSLVVLSASSLSYAAEKPQMARAMIQSSANMQICQYSFDSKVYQAQQQWLEEYDRIQHMEFFYLQVPQIIVWYQPEESKPQQLKLPIKVLVHSNYQVWGIKLLKSSGSTALDQRIQRSFKDLRVETKKGFWWGPMLTFQDEIELNLMHCQSLNQS